MGCSREKKKSSIRTNSPKENLIRIKSNPAGRHCKEWNKAVGVSFVAGEDLSKLFDARDFPLNIASACLMTSVSGVEKTSLNMAQGRP